MTGLQDIEYYERFFETIARNYLPIGHNPALGRKSFFFAKARDSADNAKTYFDKKGVKLLLHQFVTNLSQNAAGKMNSDNLGIIEVLVHFDKSKMNNEVLAQKQAILALLSIIGYMRHCHEENEAMHNFDFESFEIDPVGPVYDNFYGYQLTFTWINNVEKYLEMNPTDWNNGNYPS